MARRRKIISNRLKRIYNALFISFLVIAVGYMLAYGFLYFELQKIHQRIESEKNGLDNVASRVRETNRFVQSVHQHFKLHPAWIPLADDAISLAPSGIFFNTLQIDEDKQNIILSGVSSSRDATLLFEQKLKELSWVEEVEAPLQNFASGTSVNFTFTLKRKAP